MKKLYFTSDWHFSHGNIVKFCPTFRPEYGKDDPQKMNEYLIDVWNATVRPDDVVYNLGDVSFAKDKKDIIAVLERLNGEHHLILGNHDTLIKQHKAEFLSLKKHDGKPLLSSIQDYAKVRLRDGGHTLILSHYPMIEWEGCHKGWYHLYGHLHDRLAKVRGRALNVGFDLHGRLLSLDEIDEFLAQLPKVGHFDKDVALTSSDIHATAYAIKQAMAEINGSSGVLF